MAEATEKALLAERLGFDELWLGEHFSATSEPIPSPLMFMASLMPQTRRTRVRHRRHQPAEPASRRDRRRSRAVRPHERRAFHVRHRHRQPAVGLRAVRRRRRGKRRRMLVESIDIIERIWGRTAVSSSRGSIWNFEIRRGERDSASALFRSRSASGGPPVAVSVSSPRIPDGRTSPASGAGGGIERVGAPAVCGRHPLGRRIVRRFARPAAPRSARIGGLCLLPRRRLGRGGARCTSWRQRAPIATPSVTS